MPFGLFFDAAFVAGASALFSADAGDSEAFAATALGLSSVDAGSCEDRLAVFDAEVFAAGFAAEVLGAGVAGVFAG